MMLPERLNTWRRYLSTYLLLTLCIVLFHGCSQDNHESHKNNLAVSDRIIDSASSLLISGKVTLSMSYLDSAYNNFPDAGPVDLWRKYQMKNNFYTFYVVDPAKSRRYIDSMFLSLKGHEKTYSFEYATTLFDLGSLLLAEKKYTEAFRQFYNARTYAQMNLDSCQIGRFTNGLALVKYRQGHYLKAVPYLKQSFNEYDKCKDNTNFESSFIDPQSILNTIGLSFDHAEQPDSAIKYFQYALNFIERRSKIFPERKEYVEMAKGVIYGNLGGAYAKANQFEHSEYYLKKSIAINKRPGFSIDDAQTAEIKLTGLYLRHAKLKQADTLLNSIQASLDRQHKQQMDNNQSRLKWYELKWLYYEGHKDFALSHDYLKKYYQLKDSLQQVRLGLSTVDMDQEFERIIEQEKVDLLKRNNQLKSLGLVALLIVFVIVTVMLLVIQFNLTRYRKLSRDTREQNILLRQTLTALEQSQADNTRIMKIVAHDLRNPIGSISMLASLMLRMNDRPEKDVEWLEMIRLSASNSLELVNDMLLTNTRAEDLIKEPVDLVALTEYCVEMLRNKASDKNQLIETALEPISIYASREKLWRVVSNLISNAIKFSPINTTVTVRLYKESGFALIAVADQGIGIPDHVGETIFNMFTEAKRPGTAGEQPFGMGLAISKQIVEAHGGTIWFERNQGGGTTFYIKLPS